MLLLVHCASIPFNFNKENMFKYNSKLDIKQKVSLHVFKQNIIISKQQLTDRYSREGNKMGER